MCHDLCCRVDRCLRTKTLFINSRGSNHQFGNLSLPACGQFGWIKLKGFSVNEAETYIHPEVSDYSLSAENLKLDLRFGSFSFGYITLASNICKAVSRSLFLAPYGLNKLSEGNFKFSFSLICKSTLAFFTGQRNSNSGTQLGPRIRISPLACRQT